MTLGYTNFMPISDYASFSIFCFNYTENIMFYKCFIYFSNPSLSQTESNKFPI